MELKSIAQMWYVEKVLQRAMSWYICSTCMYKCVSVPPEKVEHSRKMNNDAQLTIT
jgi:hypothetical protein